MELFSIILATAICAGLLTFIALTLSAMSDDLSRIKQILENHERQTTKNT